jgi:hypothetical protein
MYKLYIVFFPQKTVIIFDPVMKYIENNKDKLLENYTTINANTDLVFYNKKELQELLVEKNNELEKVWRTRILFENTPRGNIIMYYDVYKHGFAYYCDTNGIPYNILNAVAMKYVTVYYCRDLFLDNEYLQEDKASPLIKLYLEAEKEKERGKDCEDTNKPLEKLDHSAFARLKNYKTKDSDKKDTENVIQKEYSRNTFVNMGKICNFNFLQKPEKKSKLNGFYSALLDGVASEGELQKEVMNYSKFKEMLSKKQNQS